MEAMLTVEVVATPCIQARSCGIAANTSSLLVVIVKSIGCLKISDFSI
jgi:hypothetical protein